MSIISEVASEWTLKKLKYIAKINYGDSLPNEMRVSGKVPVYGSNGIVDYHNKSNTNGLTIVIGRKGSFGKVNFSKKPCFAIDTTFFIDNTLTSENLKWLYYMLGTLQLDSYSQDTGVPGLSRENVYEKQVPVPDLETQGLIAEFLDKETFKIDSLINKKQRLIELLQEKRQALITNAVTKGLDPDVPMKDSGIPWLGEVPEHWDVKRLRFMLEMNPGKSELTGISEELQVSFLPMESVSEDGDIELDRHKPLSEVFSGYTYFKDRDVILAKITPCFENGKGALVDNLMNSIGFGSTEFHVLRPKQNKLDEKYLYYIIKSHAFMNIGESMMTGAAGQKRVPEDFIKNYKIGLPPYLEQKTIVKKLEKKLSDIRALTEKLLTQITKLKEYRQALITAAVTGKIDVREKVSS